MVERYEYGDYGRPVFLLPNGNKRPGTPNTSDPLIQNPHLFTGRELDAETGLLYYRTRYMDSAWGVFTSRDTIGIWLDWRNVGNGRVYVGASSQSFVDPFGEHFFDDIRDGLRRGAKWLEKQFDNLPKWLQKPIEFAIPIREGIDCAKCLHLTSCLSAGIDLIPIAKPFKIVFKSVKEVKRLGKWIKTTKRGPGPNFTTKKTGTQRKGGCKTAVAGGGPMAGGGGCDPNKGPRDKGSPKPSPKFEPPTNPPQLPPSMVPDGDEIFRGRPTEQYPDGYWKYYRKGSPVNPSTMKPGKRPDYHVPMPPGYNGPFDN